MQTDIIANVNSVDAMKELPDDCIDLIFADPPLLDAC